MLFTLHQLSQAVIDDMQSPLQKLLKCDAVWAEKLSATSSASLGVLLHIL